MTEPYLKLPDQIYQRSFQMIRNETSLGGFSSDIATVIVRLIHACGMTDIVDELEFSENITAAAVGALKNAAPILVDARMVKEGVIDKFLPADNRIICTLNDDGVAERAGESGVTRSAAAVDLWLPDLAGAVVAIGNAPTALFRLLEHLAAGVAKPAAILAFPVGFVGAAESKRALIEANLSIPFLTLHGRRGGSALAAAAVNAMARLAK